MTPVVLAAAAVAGAVALLVAPSAPAGRLAAAAGGDGPDAARPPTGGQWVARLTSRLRRIRRREVEQRSAAVVELVDGMAAELRSGRMPAAALAAAAAVGPPDLAALAGVAADGHDVAERLESTATLPGAHGLLAVASCWRVAEQSGAGLARGLEKVALGLRNELMVAREVTGQLSGPRATARLLAVLPAFGWLLGSALGADPLGVLVTTGYGRVCLLLGVPLQVAGWWWIERGASALDPGRYRGDVVTW